MNTSLFSPHIRSTLRPGTLLVRYLIVINLIFGAWYLQWRVLHSVNFNAWWLAIPLLIAEIYSYFGGVMFLLGMWRPIVRRVTSLSQMRPVFPPQEWPTVDIFITCYNEPVELVEQTARAALDLDYPKTKLAVYILDDGNSFEMRKMATQLGVADLQSPAMQQIVNQISRERANALARFNILESISSEITKAEKFLDSFRLQVETDKKALATVLSWFDNLQPASVPKQIWDELRVVLGEGFDNALCHAHQDLPQKTPIEIDLIILSDRIVIQIWDRGAEFDWYLNLREIPEQVEITATRGRGIKIMEQLVDYVNYIRTADKQNCLVTIKLYQKTGSLTEHQTEQEQLISYLQSFEQLAIIFNNQHATNLDLISSEKKALNEIITQQELELTRLMRCRYIARPKPEGKPHHAKAGNINYALFSGETSGEFILTLDADHIPKPQFLQRIIPYFYKYNINGNYYEANNIAFVQTPQAFYNLPADDPFGHQAHLFYGPIQQGKDGTNAAFYTGTNAVLRREALISVGLQNFAEEFTIDENRLDEFDLIGGVSSNSITEDMNTAMRLHDAGWQSLYHHEELAEGLAPDDLSSTLKQRLRWAQGTIQVLLRENPFAKSGLSFWQQLQYFQTMYSYFSGFFTFIFIICPIIFFFTGIIPVRSYGIDFAIHFIPAFILNRLTFIASSWGITARELWRSEQYAIALFPLFIQSVWSVFTGKSIKFQVTPKQRQSGIYLRLVWIQLTLVVLTILGIILSLYRFIIGDLEQPGLYLLNTAWASYNMALLWIVIKAAIWQPKQS